MRRFSFVVLLIIATLVTVPFPTAAETRELTVLIATLDRLNTQGSHCGDELDVHGLRAVSSTSCKSFTTAFHSEWRDRAALDSEVADHMARLEQSRSPCDSACLATLKRVDDLKKLVTYYLDYIDFLIESEN